MLKVKVTNLSVQNQRKAKYNANKDNVTLSESLCVFSVAEFSIWTREAGAGGLSIAVEGPSKAEITFEDRKDGSCGVAYVVQEPGKTRRLKISQ